MPQAAKPAMQRARLLPYVILLVLAFMGFVVVLVPVQVVWQQVKSPQIEIQPNGLKGTLWRGSADWVEWRDYAAQVVRWSFNPWGLLRGLWEYQVDLTVDGAPITGYLGLTPTGEVQARTVQAKVLLQDLKYINQNPQLQLPSPVQGELQVELDELVLHGQWPAVLRGDLLLTGVELVGLTQLGDWKGQLANTAVDQMTLQFAPVGNLLVGEGVWVLNQNGQWNLTLKIKPHAAQLNSDIATLLGLLGSPDSQGYYVIKQRGRLR